MRRRGTHHALLLLLAFTVLHALAAPAVQLETPYLRFTLSPEDGHCELLDKRANFTWRTDTNHLRFGRALLYLHGNPREVNLTRCQAQRLGDTLALGFQPLPEQPATMLRAWVRVLPDRQTLAVSYQEDTELDVDDISLLTDLFAATDSAHGYVVVPVREGLLIPADSGLAFKHRFDTYDYEGCHMAMYGVVQAGAAALFTWTNPYTALSLTSTVLNTPSPTRQRLSPALVQRKSARSFQIHLLGKGDHVTIAQAYRQVAREEGWFVPWTEKLKTNPERAQLFGAANVKLWSALTRRMNLESTHEESVQTNWTFQEAAQVAEHLKHDLKLDRVLFTLGGWIHRGYDNQHPDILPTAPECGGDAAFADCARRVRDLGYLFCLHDNYQDIYRDSPSWNEHLIMKNEDGELVHGGHWNGGRAYLTCSQMACDLARRPQNLPAVRKLSGANAYFIDTTYAAALQECYDPTHPLTRADDIYWKQALSDYARGVFGIFGSECGREWAIPHSDFFEGLTGVSGHAYHNAELPIKLGATVVPLFELVYRDCIALYGKYGYSPQTAAEYVLQHISLARPLNYHSIPAHLYWKQPRGAKPSAPPPAAGLDPALFCRADNGWAEGLHPLDRFLKNTCEVLCPLNELTAQLPMTRHEFLTPDHKIQRTIFGEGKTTVQVIVNASGTNYVCACSLGGQLTLPPGGFVADSRTFVAFYGAASGESGSAPPACFTLRALDGKPISNSRQVRVYHGFGPDQIRIGRTTHTVSKETILH